MGTELTDANRRARDPSLPDEERPTGAAVKELAHHCEQCCRFCSVGPNLECPPPGDATAIELPPAWKLPPAGPD